MESLNMVELRAGSDPKNKEFDQSFLPVFG
jgi:hypothetical protein